MRRKTKRGVDVFLKVEAETTVKPPKPHQMQTKTNRLTHKDKSAFAQSAKVAHWVKVLVVKLAD